MSHDTKENKDPSISTTSDGAKEQAPEENAIALTISAYFESKNLSPNAFFKALKAAKIRQFDRQDEQRALELISAHDLDGERFWSLMSQATLPEAVDRWIWIAAQDRLKIVIGAGFEPSSEDPLRILDQILNALGGALISKEKSERHSGENWLRIGIRWLMEKRSLGPWPVADKVRSVIFSKTGDAVRAATEVLQRGRSTEFKQFLAVAGLAKTIIEVANRDRDLERRTAGTLRQKVDSLSTEVEALQASIVAIRNELATALEALANTQTQLETEKQHAGHDLSETKAEQRVRLERVSPLLTDAADALEIEPPAIQTALKRLKSALAIIREAQK